MVADIDELFDEYWEKNQWEIHMKGIEDYPHLVSSIIKANGKVRDALKDAYKAGFRKAKQLSILRTSP